MKTTKVNEYDKETGERCIAKITFDEEDLRKIVHKTLENNDFVQVVRCKNCKKAETNNCPMYRAHFGYTDDDYCSCGEWKEQDNE